MTDQAGDDAIPAEVRAIRDQLCPSGEPSTDAAPVFETAPVIDSTEGVAWNEMIGQALADLWQSLAPRDSLLPDLPFDAVLARADHGELRPCLPRLLEVATLPGASPDLAAAVFDRLEAAEWQQWPERGSILHLLDQWWATELALEPGDPAVHEVLAVLARLDVPLVRWLRPWLEDLDGPGSRHLVRMIGDGFDSPRWEDRPDARRQIRAWTRSEPVILGLTLVGGTHLEPGQLGDALDRML